MYSFLSVHLLQLRKPNAPQDWLKKLPAMAKRLEESLYRGAATFQQYNDESSLKSRLQQLAMNIGAKKSQHMQKKMMLQRQAQQQQAQQQAQMQNNNNNQLMQQQQIPLQQPQMQAPMQQAPQVQTAQQQAQRSTMVNMSDINPIMSQKPQQMLPPQSNPNNTNNNVVNNTNTAMTQMTSNNFGPQSSLMNNQGISNSLNDPNKMNTNVHQQQQAQNVSQHTMGMQQLQNNTQQAQQQQTQQNTQQTSSINNSSSLTNGGNDLMRSGSDRQQVLRHQQQRLLLLRHAAKCPHEDKCCPVTPHCAGMKRLWKHIAECKDQKCLVPHCVSSRYVLSHYHRCKDVRCPVCGPVREAIHRSHEKAKQQQMEVLKRTHEQAMQQNQMGTNGNSTGNNVNQQQQVVTPQQQSSQQQMQMQQHPMNQVQQQTQHLQKPQQQFQMQQQQQQLQKPQQLQQQQQQQQMLLQQQQQQQSSYGGNSHLMSSHNYGASNQNTSGAVLSAPVMPTGLPGNSNKRRKANNDNKNALGQQQQQFCQPALSGPQTLNAHQTNTSHPTQTQPSSIAVPTGQVDYVYNNSNAQGPSGGKNQPNTNRNAVNNNFNNGATNRRPKPQEDHTLMNCFTTEQIETHIASLNKGLVLPQPKLKATCLDVLKLLMGHQHGWVFNNPVDPVELGLPDYFQIIKHPMDLGSIKKRLENGCYHSLNTFEADVHLTFDNAMLYNKEGSVVYNMAKELKDKFIRDYAKVIEQLNRAEDEKRKKGEACALCGCEKLLFEPPVFYCNGSSSGLNCPQKRIRRNSYYYVGGNNQYHWCQNCFGELKDNQTLDMGDISMKKEELLRKRNDEVAEESWVQCDHCNRWIHQICGLFNTRQNKHQTSEYSCPRCMIERRKNKSITQGNSTTPMAEDLPRTKLSEWLEKAVRGKIYDKISELAREKAEREVSLFG